MTFKGLLKAYRVLGEVICCWKPHNVRVAHSRTRDEHKLPINIITLINRSPGLSSGCSLDSLELPQQIFEEMRVGLIENRYNLTIHVSPLIKTH